MSRRNARRKKVLIGAFRVCLRAIAPSPSLRDLPANPTHLFIAVEAVNIGFETHAFGHRIGDCLIAR
jgi:hypothetical protein